MSLKSIRQYFQQISFKITLAYLVFFIISSIFTFGLIYFLAAQSLETRDKKIITAKLREYSSLYLDGGVSDLTKISKNQNLQNEGAKFLIRLSNPAGDTLFLNIPKELNGVTPESLMNSLRSHFNELGWFIINADNDEDDFEVITEHLPDGNLLQVGMSTDDRDDVLERVRNIFLLALIPTFLLGAFGGIVFARRTFRPIRHLISTIHDIQSGDLNARVKETGSSDELDELSQIFNQMLNRTGALIRGMNEALDNVAHDLRTPMTHIKMTAEKVLQNASPDQYTECHEALLECVEGSDRILTLLNALMDISDAEAGILKLNKTDIDAAKLVSEVIDLYSFVAEEKGLLLKNYVQETFDIYGDESRIRQALANLLDNAIKYSDKNSTIYIRGRSTSEGVDLSVEDSGRGISEFELTRIWERLYRGDKSRSERGLGIGLSLVKSIIEAHNGTVKAKSRVDIGSSFSIHLPHKNRSNT